MKYVATFTLNPVGILAGSESSATTLKPISGHALGAKAKTWHLFPPANATTEIPR